MAEKKFPEWIRIVYRGVRTAVAAGVVSVGAQVAILKPDWSEPGTAFRMAAVTVVVAFASGFLVSFGMWARDILDKYFDYDEKSVFARFMPV